MPGKDRITKPVWTVYLAVLFMVLSCTGSLAKATDLTDKRYKQAASYYNNSCAFSVKQLSRSQWQECLRLFEKAFDSNPKDREIAPKALYMMAKIYGKSYEQFGMREDLKASAAYYEKLSFRFPDHSLADDALVALGKIVLTNKDKKDVVDKERLLAKALVTYGQEEAADLLMKRLQDHSLQRSGDKVVKPASKATVVNSIRQPAAHAAHITRPVRFWSNKNYTRVVIEASAPVRFKENVLKAEGKLPPRLYVDLFDCRIPSTFQNPITIQDGLLKRSRAAQFDPSTARVVIDLETFSQYKIFSLHEPFRVVIDITGTKKKELVPTRPIKPRKPWDKDKEFTLAEQLGLGVKTIVIDAGHGGKDPGAIGRKGLREKDVVLKVALKTRDALRKKGYKVILTRSTDKYLPLEERTAIANTKNADLFLSIHANSAPNRRARGLETYYLSLATTKEEKQAAALENAVSSKQLSELQNILSDIMKNSKIDESRKFAGTVQRSMASGMKKRYKNVKNLGVKKAPFFVLIGAQMPSVLAEIAFLSNKEEEKRLRSDAYLTALATELANGVEMYSRSLQ